MQLAEVLRLFDSPLSQEQCWSICYGTCRTLMKKKSEDAQRRERIKYILNLDSLILTQRGEIEILHSEPNFQETQNESELIFAIGNLICRCLDHGLDEEQICEVKFQDDLAELIGAMVLQNSEFDEGIGDSDSLGESWESRKFISSQHRSFKLLTEVTRFCEARLLRRNIEKKGHYFNVSKALYVEASELKAFLGHVMYDFEQDSNVSLDDIEGPELAKRYVKEWAKLWLQVMDELRQKTKSQRQKLTPEDYQSTPFHKVLQGDKASLGNDISKTHVQRTDSLPENAEDRIFNFLKSRVSSQEDLKNSENAVCVDNIDAGLSDVNCSRKVVVVQAPLVRKISDWNHYSLDDTLEDDFLNGSYLSDDDEPALSGASSPIQSKKRIPLLDVPNTDNDNRRKSEEIDASHASVFDFTPRRHTLASVSKHRLTKSALNLHEIDIEDKSDDSEKIGASLTEIFKIRQEITRSEMEMTCDKDVRHSKKCFACKKNKFTFFQRAKQCSVCTKKFCSKCMRENTPIPAHLIEAAPPNLNVIHSGNPSPLLSSSQHLCRSMFNLNSKDTEKQFSFLRNKSPSRMLQLHMCIECKNFLESIEGEQKKSKWTVQLELTL